MTRFFFVALLLAASFLSAQQPTPTQDSRSLAERAASLRKKSADETVTSSNQPQARGLNCNYKNVAFGLEIKCLDGWKGLSRGQLNTAKAVTRTKETLEFAMGGQNGNNVIISLEPALYRKDFSSMKAALFDDAKAQLADLPPNRVSVDLRDEPLSLSDAAHKFAAVRLKVPGLTQSLQLVALNGTAI